MQTIHSALSNIRNNHNDRKNDTLLYWISFGLFLMTTCCGIFSAPFITASDSPIAIIGAIVFLFLFALTTHWYQCLSARYFYPLSENQHQTIDIHDIGPTDTVDFQ